MPSFREFREKRISIQHAKAVWQHLYDYLEEFTANDAVGQNQKVIEADGCETPFVSESIIDLVRSHIRNEIVAEYDKQLTSLDSDEV